MPARDNYIVVCPASWEDAKQLLSSINSLIRDWIGEIETLSVQNVATGSVADRRLAGGLLTTNVPDVSNDEIVALYSSAVARGAVLMTHEGKYNIIIVSTMQRGPVLDRLK